MPVCSHPHSEVSSSPSRADLGLPPRHGDRVLRESCDHLPLFSAGRTRAGTALHAQACMPPAPAGRPLSIGHKTSNSDNQRVAESEIKNPLARLVKVWADGSRADFPGIESSNPRNRHSPAPKRSPRGKVLSFSESSRRRCQRDLATIERDAIAYTMALTMPGNIELISNQFAKRVFLILLNRMTASRIPEIAALGAFWKQELQTRGALHFHLLIWGVSEDRLALVHQWLALQWHELICLRSSAQERKDHLAVHLMKENFQRVRNMAGYFSKYLGKAETDLIAEEPIPGRWWGKVNCSNIPWAKCSELEVPERFAIFSQRIARKLRQHRADDAKHRAISRKIQVCYDKTSSHDPGGPLFSRFALTCGAARKGTPLGDALRTLAKSEKVSFGPYKMPDQMKFSRVVLVGPNAPATAKRILEFAGHAYRDYLKANPF